MLLRELRRSEDLRITHEAWDAMSSAERDEWLRIRLTNWVHNAGRAQRRFEIMVLLLIVGVFLGAFVMYGYLSGRDARRQALKDVVCLILRDTQPNTEFHASLAQMYPDCPSYQRPADAVPGSASPSATPSAPRSRPSGHRAVPKPRTSTVVLPGGRTTVVVSKPQPVVRTTTKTVTKPVRTPTSPRSSPCPLPPVILPGLITVPPIC